jgi:hypothetical protein
MPPDGTLMNGNVFGKMKRYLHPEAWGDDWQGSSVSAGLRRHQGGSGEEYHS